MTARANLEAAALLRRARDRIVPPGAWIKWYRARDRRGGIDPTSPHAVAWCAIGATCAELGVDTAYQAWDAPALRYLSEAAIEQGDSSPSVINDNTVTRWPVLAMFNRAIAIAEGRP